MIRTPISVGELIDKITILRLKRELITDDVKRANVLRELALLEELSQQLDWREIELLAQDLARVNRELWHIEDFKRSCERQGKFDNEFVEAARRVYIYNDLRAELKRQINLKTNSEIIEEKSY